MKWLNGAQSAVALSFDFDAETLWLSRDPANANKVGTLSQGIYGAKVGVPSILDVLEKHGIKATFFVPGWVAEKYDDLVRDIVAQGHEIGHHGYLHEWVDPQDPKEEEDIFKRGLDALVKVTGKKPVGYRSPAWETSENILNILKEHDFLYSSNMMDQIDPYFLKIKGEETKLVELPVHWMLDDAPFFLFSVKPPSRPMFSARSVLQLWKEEFHAIYRRGLLFNLVSHPQIIGRPSRIDMLDELITYIKSYPNIWFATGEEIAQFYRGSTKGN